MSTDSQVVVGVLEHAFGAGDSQTVRRVLSTNLAPVLSERELVRLLLVPKADRLPDSAQSIDAMLRRLLEWRRQHI